MLGFEDTISFEVALLLVDVVAKEKDKVIIAAKAMSIRTLVFMIDVFMFRFLLISFIREGRYRCRLQLF